MEWANDNKYNSFNTVKGLTYYERYKRFLSWLDGKGELPPPVEVNLDPIAECNLSCKFCITQRYLKTHREEVGEMRRLPTEYLYRLVKFLSEWGVSGLCVSGGGEPTLHDGAWGLNTYATDRGMKTAWFTNATYMKDRLIHELLKCQWVALSVDAADKEVYVEVKGRNCFNDVIQNISRMVDRRGKEGSDVRLCYKFAILPENQRSIFKACLLAKELGVQDFHARPVDYERQDIDGAHPLELDLDSIKDQFAACHGIEDKSLHVYTVTHKFDPEFHVKHDFTRCLATPLILPILSDGNAYLCVDRKMERDFRLGSCYPDPGNILKFWGSDYHRELIKKVNIQGCSRCTISQYNRQIEETLIQDNMCLSFP